MVYEKFIEFIFMYDTFFKIKTFKNGSKTTSI